MNKEGRGKGKFQRRAIEIFLNNFFSILSFLSLKGLPLENSVHLLTGTPGEMNTPFDTGLITLLEKGVKQAELCRSAHASQSNVAFSELWAGETLCVASTAQTQSVRSWVKSMGWTEPVAPLLHPGSLASLSTHLAGWKGGALPSLLLNKLSSTQRTPACCQPQEGTAWGGGVVLLW